MPVSSSARSPRPAGAAKAASSKTQPAQPAKAKKAANAAPSKPAAAQPDPKQPSRTSKTGPAKARPAEKSKAAVATVAQKTAAQEPPAAADETGPQIPERPLPVLIAAALTGLIGSVLVAYGVYLVIAGFSGHPVERARAETAGAIFLVLGLGVAWAARGLGRLQPWARTPSMIALLAPLGVAYWMHQGGMNLWAVVFLVVGIGSVVLLFLPSSHRVLSRDVH